MGALMRSQLLRMNLKRTLIVRLSRWLCKRFFPLLRPDELRRRNRALPIRRNLNAMESARLHLFIQQHWSFETAHRGSQLIHFDGATGFVRSG